MRTSNVFAVEVGSAAINVIYSLRAGLATSAARNGASERSIMNQTGHKSHSMVRRYIRDGTVFHDNAAGKPGGK